MKYEITRRGVYGADGAALAVGDTIEVEGKETPAWLVNKAEPVKGGKAANDTTPADEAPAGPFTVEDGGKGWWSILDAKGAKVGKGLREDDAKAFADLSTDDQTAFAAEHAKA